MGAHESDGLPAAAPLGLPPSSDADPLDAYSRAVVDAAERVNAAVVNIEIRKRPRPSPGTRQPRREPAGTGSGFVFSQTA